MHRSYPNVAPVANRYLGLKLFIKAQEEHEKNLKNVHSVVDSSKPVERPHCTQRTRQKKMKEYQLLVIEQENERQRIRMEKSECVVDTHNNYILNGAYAKRRQEQQVRHEREVQRLQRMISAARPSYSAREYQDDYNRKKEIQKRMTRFPTAK